MSEERAVQIAKITNELEKMKVGHCGQKYGVLVWKIGDNCFSVGLESVSFHESFSIESAARLCVDLPKCANATR